ncbi:uncharacterized protein CANTADRAFT_95137 [Suhomyces tanzawaensis NRRL Y-17324]|uniref:Uncharacterized protein n=1 Tax=Suhomyces tanzawaensis NRRL Y-17324 TaxID=984487 RepID=A0A1E4SLS9_9ASCO|nr:uncharacterized protein CANTADRAFT_95137 [Suhomyces tanzawaensis NRRL Y-17324]ODV80342.1 hypothetical protein CANTADRAFT_95137 [Suhomyces tanzawaensis NRRL Y-17324]
MRALVLFQAPQVIIAEIAKRAKHNTDKPSSSINFKEMTWSSDLLDSKSKSNHCEVWNVFGSILRKPHSSCHEHVWEE